MKALPRWIEGLAAAAAIALMLPIVGLVTQIPWGRAGSVITSDVVREALWLSILTSASATVAAIVLGVPLSLWLAQTNWRAAGLIRALAAVSLVLPPVVAGLALLATLGRNGVIGQVLYDRFGITIPFTPAAVVIAQTFVALPFVVLTVESALVSVDRRLEHAARSLGATRTDALRRVTIPVVRSALQAGAVLAFARALGEFGATVTFAGSFPGRTQTLPLAAYQALEVDPGAAMTMGLVLVMASVVVILLLRGRWWSRLAGERRL